MITYKLTFKENLNLNYLNVANFIGINVYILELQLIYRYKNWKLQNKIRMGKKNIVYYQRRSTQQFEKSIQERNQDLLVPH